MKLKLPDRFSPYQGVIYFVVVLIITHFFWKFTMVGDESDDVVTFFGLNLTGFFNFMSTHTAQVSARILQIFNPEVQLLPQNMIKHGNGEAVRIIWACTGIKQAYIFIFIIALYRGPWKKKLWFIPLGVAIVYLFNIFRITAIAALVENHANMFDFVHGYLLKYLFYAVIFGLWVWWEEKISGNNAKKNRAEGK